ncbi:MAG: hypothetical protein HMLKMBBP_02495 [Planctomycetes bacterium]|nr:hypothetical protein [Planctomycetota bacterium]
MKKTFDFDRLGAWASFACAIHCAAIPILIGLGAAGAVSWIDHAPVEWGLVGFAAIVGTVSAWRGYRVHGNATVAVVLCAAALSLGVLTWMTHAAEPGVPHMHDHVHADGTVHAAHTGDRAWLFPILGVVIAVTHLVNRKLCKSCTTCDAHAHAAAVAPERARS